MKYSRTPTAKSLPVSARSRSNRATCRSPQAGWGTVCGAVPSSPLPAPCRLPAHGTAQRLPGMPAGVNEPRVARAKPETARKKSLPHSTRRKLRRFSLRENTGVHRLEAAPATKETRKPGYPMYHVPRRLKWWDRPPCLSISARTCRDACATGNSRGTIVPPVPCVGRVFLLHEFFSKRTLGSGKFVTMKVSIERVAECLFQSIRRDGRGN